MFVVILVGVVVVFGFRGGVVGKFCYVWGYFVCFVGDRVVILCF